MGYFVTPLHIDHSMFITDDHLDDMDDGFDFSKFQDVFSEPLSDYSSSRILKPGVDLVEHGLIAAFQPPYNKKLKKWDQDSSTLSIRKMQEARLRLLSLHRKHSARPSGVVLGNGV